MPHFASPNIHKVFIYCSVIDQHFVFEKRLAVIVFGISQYYSTGKSLQNRLQRRQDFIHWTIILLYGQWINAVFDLTG